MMELYAPLIPAAVIFAGGIAGAIARSSERHEAQRLEDEKAAQRKAHAEQMKQIKAQRAQAMREAAAECKAEAKAAKAAEREAEKAEKKAARTVKAFSGESVAFTGTAPNMTRKKLIELTEAAGGKAYEKINTGSTLLVVCAKPGKTQLERAEKWHVKTITFDEWQYRLTNGKAAAQAKSDKETVKSIDFSRPISLEQFEAWQNISAR